MEHAMLVMEINNLYPFTAVSWHSHCANTMYTRMQDNTPPLHPLHNIQVLESVQNFLTLCTVAWQLLILQMMNKKKFWSYLAYIKFWSYCLVNIVHRMFSGVQFQNLCLFTNCVSVMYVWGGKGGRELLGDTGNSVIICCGL